MNCSAFVHRYSNVSSTFRCFVSRADPELVIVDLDLNEIHRDLFYSVAIPVPCLVLAVGYLIMACKCIYNKKVVKKVRGQRPSYLLSRGSRYVT